MKAGIVQLNPEFENRENNILNVIRLLDENLKEEKLIIFPEMTLTGYTMNTKDFSEEIDGTGLNFFINQARKRKVHIFAGIIEKDEDKYYNSLFHINNDGIIAARYRKIHPFSFAGEEKYFDASDETVITKIDDIKIGLSICYDLRFPELFRYYGKERCDLIINISNWPVQRMKHYRILSQARAVENLCYFISSNRLGRDPYNEYIGSSAVFDPSGEPLVEENSDKEFISIEINKEIVDSTRKRYPFLNDIKLI